jgi:hypothetical protein
MRELLQGEWLGQERDTRVEDAVVDQDRGQEVRNGKPLRASPIAIPIAKVTAMTQIAIG